jgi:hypothetical protein
MGADVRLKLNGIQASPPIKGYGAAAILISRKVSLPSEYTIYPLIVNSAFAQQADEFPNYHIDTA